LPLAGEHAVHFAHDGVWICRKFQRVRQQHRVHRIAVHRQLRRSPDDIGALPQLQRSHDCLSASAALREQFPSGAPRADLQKFPAEDIFERFAQQLGFRAQETRAEWALPPRFERRVSVRRA
jgi:hypothetical protein